MFQIAHRKRSHVAALSQDGAQLLSRRITSTLEEFLRVFGDLGPAELEVAFEATCGWGWFADLLVDVGIPAHMAHRLGPRRSPSLG
jgi:hypothetical protein